MSRIFAGLVAAVLALAAVGSGAEAGPVTLTADLSKKPPAGASTLDLGSVYDPARPAQTLHLGDATIGFSGGSELFKGSVGGVAAAPYTGTGPDKNPYFSAEPGGAITIAFSRQQKYFGLLWGSVDGYNHLAFYDGAVKVASFSGTDVTKSANGDRGFAGTYFVNVDFSSPVTFDRVVATSDSPAFEFDSVTNAAVPEPSALVLFATGLAGLAMLYWHRRPKDQPTS
jgi:hypothetical protein